MTARPPDSPLAAASWPRPIWRAAWPWPARLPHSALYRHADGRGGAQGADQPRLRGLGALSDLGGRRDRPVGRRERSARGTPAKRCGKAKAISTRPRSGSRSSIPAMTAARPRFRNPRSRRRSSSRATSAPAGEIARAGARPFRHRARRASRTRAKRFRGSGCRRAASATGPSLRRCRRRAFRQRGGGPAGAGDAGDARALRLWRGDHGRLRSPDPAGRSRPSSAISGRRGSTARRTASTIATLKALIDGPLGPAV